MNINGKKIADKKLVGNAGEQAVEKWLALNNFKILARNYSIRYGEVDLIAEKGDVIAFIEVKTRKTEYFPTSSVVNKSKQLKIIKAAKHFVLQNQIRDKVLRFDVATVLLNANGTSVVSYIPNAFMRPKY
jgi:putative endonuclease